MAHTAEARQKLREICRVAARVFYEKGYDGASMQDIAQAVGLTKAGLYHHVSSKDMLLFEIMNYGMDILDEEVLAKVKDIQDPREKLRRTILGHIDLVVRARDMEITVILHENRSLKGELAQTDQCAQKSLHRVSRGTDRKGAGAVRHGAKALSPYRRLRCAGDDQLALPVVPSGRACQGRGNLHRLHGLLLPRIAGRCMKPSLPWGRGWIAPAILPAGAIRVRGSSMPNPTVAFQGERGSFSEEAAYKLLGRRITVKPCETFGAIFESVVSGKTKYCLAPIENTLAGSVHENYDLLLSNDLHIIGEVNLRIVHNLIAPTGHGAQGHYPGLLSPRGLSSMRRVLQASSED